MEQSDRDISQWDARLKEQLERSFHNYHNRRIDLSVARDSEKLDWTGETLIVEKASSADAIATVRLMFEDADELTLQENVDIKSIFNRIYISNEVQTDEWLDVIAGINFEYKKKIEGGGGLTYVDRGDISSEDFNVGDYTIDTAWHDMDWSGIIDPGALLVLIRLGVKNNEAGRWMKWRPKGYTNNTNVSMIFTQVSLKDIDLDLLIRPDGNGIVQYCVHDSGTWSSMTTVIRGWFV